MIIKPACYVKGEPQYFIDNCPQPKHTPAYHPVNAAAVLLANRPTPTIDTRPYTQPTPQFVDPYPITNRAPAGGLYLIDQLGHGNFNITAPDGGLTICSSTACFQP